MNSFRVIASTSLPSRCPSAVPPSESRRRPAGQSTCPATHGAVAPRAASCDPCWTARSPFRLVSSCASAVEPGDRLPIVEPLCQVAIAMPVLALRDEELIWDAEPRVSQHFWSRVTEMYV